ncbi:hypothetical protein [Streptomyces yangpuensis]|uniref:hypothetical protein n=1 Tax=Streptomyces yangpuensis TaxID=1648182 RepID=UPI00062924B1|nr:hypothetical protein [Streptomyces yangpuensis]
MSIGSLAVRAHRRRSPGPADRPGEARAWAAASGPTETEAAAGQLTSDALVAALPTEVIVLYTSVLGVLSGVLEDDDAASYVPLRWGLYCGCILATALALNVTYVFTGVQRKEEVGSRGGPLPPNRSDDAATSPHAKPDNDNDAGKEGMPVAETLMACVSFAVWGLVVPGSPLYVILLPPTLPVVVAVLSAAGTFFAAVVFAPWLNRKAGRAADAKRPTS